MESSSPIEIAPYRALAVKKFEAMQASLVRMRAEMENERKHRVAAERLLAEATRDLRQYREVGEQLRHLDDGPITSIGQIRPPFEGWCEPATHMAQLTVHRMQSQSRKRAAIDPVTKPEAKRACADQNQSAVLRIDLGRVVRAEEQKRSREHAEMNSRALSERLAMEDLAKRYPEQFEQLKAERLDQVKRHRGE
jgi:hypothetical protein